MTNPRKTKLIHSLSFSRFSLLHREISSYYCRWDTKKVIEIIDFSIIEDFYTVLQYLNRALSVAGASTYLAGETNENTTYKKIGGAIAVVSLYLDFLASYGKEKLFKPEERKKKWDKLISDTENLYDVYQELLEILEPIYIFDSLGRLGEIVKYLKDKVQEIVKNDNNGNSREFALLSDGPSESSGIKQRLGRLFSSKRHLLENWKKWGDEWENRRSEQKELKSLIKILQQAISKYRQGIPDNEIEEEIEKRMIGLGINLGRTQINIGNSSQTSLIESTDDNSHSLLLSSVTEEIELEIQEARLEVLAK